MTQTQHLWLMMDDKTNPEFERFFNSVVVLSKAHEPQQRMNSFILEIADYSDSAYQTFRKETKWIHLLELCIPGVIHYPMFGATSKEQINTLIERYGTSHFRRSNLESF